MAENLDQRLATLKSQLDAANKPKPEAPQGLAAFALMISRWGERRATKVAKAAEPHRGF